MGEWLSYKTKLGKSHIQIYPLRKQKSDPTEPEWVTKLEQWGADQEIRQLDNAYKKELNCSKKSPDATKIKQKARRLRLQPILQAWRQATR